MSNFKKIAEFINGIQPKQSHCDKTKKNSCSVAVKNSPNKTGDSSSEDQFYEEMMEPLRRIFKMAPIYKNDK